MGDLSPKKKNTMHYRKNLIIKKETMFIAGWENFAFLKFPTIEV